MKEPFVQITNAELQRNIMLYKKEIRRIVRGELTLVALEELSTYVRKLRASSELLKSRGKAEDSSG